MFARREAPWRNVCAPAPCQASLVQPAGSMDPPPSWRPVRMCAPPRHPWLPVHSAHTLYSGAHTHFHYHRKQFTASDQPSRLTLPRAAAAGSQRQAASHSCVCVCCFTPNAWRGGRAGLWLMTVGFKLYFSTRSLLCEVPCQSWCVSTDRRQCTHEGGVVVACSWYQECMCT